MRFIVCRTQKKESKEGLNLPIVWVKPHDLVEVVDRHMAEAKGQERFQDRPNGRYQLIEENNFYSLSFYLPLNISLLVPPCPNNIFHSTP